MKRLADIAWDDVRVVAAVAATGSLTAAARQLRLSVPTVGRRLDRLEEALGLRLFQRHSGGVTATDGVEPILERAATVAQGVDDFLRAAAALERGEGRVTVSSLEILIEHVLAPALPAFRAAHPGIDLVFRADSRIVSLERRVADVALRVVRPHEARVVGKRVGTVGFGLYASAGYLARSPVEAPGELRGHAAVMYAAPWDGLPEMRWLTERLGGTEPAYQVATAASMAAIVRSGAALGVLPTFLAEGLVRLAEPEAETRHVWVVLHEDLRRVPHVRAVADFLGDTVAAALPPL